MLGLIVGESSLPKFVINKSLKKILEWNKQIKSNNCLEICKNQIKEFLYE